MGFYNKLETVPEIVVGPTRKHGMKQFHVHTSVPPGKLLCRPVYLSQLTPDKDASPGVGCGAAQVTEFPVN